MNKIQLKKHFSPNLNVKRISWCLNYIFEIKKNETEQPYWLHIYFSKYFKTIKIDLKKIYCVAYWILHNLACYRISHFSLISYSPSVYCTYMLIYVVCVCLDWYSFGVNARRLILVCLPYLCVHMCAWVVCCKQLLPLICVGHVLWLGGVYVLFNFFHV